MLFVIYQLLIQRFKLLEVMMNIRDCISIGNKKEFIDRLKLSEWRSAAALNNDY